MFKYYRKEEGANLVDQVYRVDKSCVPQFVADCRNSYYAEVIPLLLSLTQQDLAKLMVMTHGTEPELFDKLNAIFSATGSFTNE